MAKRKAKTRRVMVLTPNGKYLPRTIPVAGFKAIRAVLASLHYRVITR
jgi:hypothetical protein